MGLYNFLKTRSAELGHGVSDFALLKPQSNARVLPTGAGRIVISGLNPTATVPQVIAFPTTTKVSLRGNGVYLAGQLTLQSLTDFEKNRRARQGA